MASSEYCGEKRTIGMPSDNDARKVMKQELLPFGNVDHPPITRSHEMPDLTHAQLSGSERHLLLHEVHRQHFDAATQTNEGNRMKVWTAPEVREQNVGLEVTSYLPADIDLI